jgi:hypothetical protein
MVRIWARSGVVQNKDDTRRVVGRPWRDGGVTGAFNPDTAADRRSRAVASTNTRGAAMVTDNPDDRNAEETENVYDLAAGVGFLVYGLDKLIGPVRPGADELERRLASRAPGEPAPFRVPILAAWHDGDAECVVEPQGVVLRDRLLDLELYVPLRSLAEVTGDGPVLRLRSGARRWKSADHDGWFAVTLRSEGERIELGEAIETARRAAIERFADQGRWIARNMLEHPGYVTSAERLALMLYFGLGAADKRPSWEEAARALELPIRDAEAEVARYAVLTAMQLNWGRPSLAAGTGRPRGGVQ